MGELLAVVACETGQPLAALLDQPLWQLVYTHHHLARRAERQRLHDRLERVDMAIENARAFNDPPTLLEQQQQAIDAILAFDRGPVDAVTDAADFRARAEALAFRVMQGRALSSEGLVS